MAVEAERVARQKKDEALKQKEVAEKAEQAALHETAQLRKPWYPSPRSPPDARCVTPRASDQYQGWLEELLRENQRLVGENERLVAWGEQVQQHKASALQQKELAEKELQRALQERHAALRLDRSRARTPEALALRQRE